VLDPSFCHPLFSSSCAPQIRPPQLRFVRRSLSRHENPLKRAGPIFVCLPGSASWQLARHRRLGLRALPSCFVHFDSPKASPRQASIFFVSVVSARSSFLGLAQDARGQGFLLPLLILVGHQERCADARTVPVPFGLTLFVMQQYSCFELCSSSDLVSVSLSPDFLS
jgi:hypothetical protein